LRDKLHDSTELGALIPTVKFVSPMGCQRSQRPSTEVEVYCDTAQFLRRLIENEAKIFGEKGR